MEKEAFANSLALIYRSIYPGAANLDFTRRASAVLGGKSNSNTVCYQSMCSPVANASYTQEMGHISYFKRVNIDEHLKIQ